MTIEGLPKQTVLEQTVIGVLLNQPQYFDGIKDVIEVRSAFSSIDAQVIYTAMDEIRKKYPSYDITLVTDFLEKHGALSRIGGKIKLISFQNEAESVTEEQFGQYINQINRESQRRKLSKELVKGVELISEPDLDLEIFTSQLKQKLELQFSTTQDIYEPIAKSAAEVIEEISLKESGELPELQGISTGYPTLDKVSKGLKGGEVTIIAARPGVGKTAFALNIATNIALITQKPILFYSLEMSNKMIAERVISIISGINQESIQTGKLSEREKTLLNKTSEVISKVNIELKNAGMITAQTISNEVRQFHNKTPVGAVIIDYLQLISSSGNENRNQQISEISRNLKLLATDLNVPVIALSQLSRSIEQRQNKRPLLSDLRESGSIEQDASLIAFIQQDEVLEVEDEEGSIVNADLPTLTTLVIAKNRSGELKDIKFNFHKNIQRFKELNSTMGRNFSPENNQLLNYATPVDAIELNIQNKVRENTKIIPIQDNGKTYAVEEMTKVGTGKLVQNNTKFIFKRDNIPKLYLEPQETSISVSELEEKLKGKVGAYLYGDMEKATSLALEVFKSKINSDPQSVKEIKYLNYLDFINEITFENRGPIMRDLNYKKLLVINNFGLDLIQNRFSNEVIISLLKTRIDNRLQTLLISASNPSEFESTLLSGEDRSSRNSKTAEFIAGLIRTHEVIKI